MSNINKFDEYAGRTFGMLYESFPVPADITAGEVMGLSDMYRNSGIPPEMRDDVDIAICSVKWLADAGYIKMAGGGGGEFFDLVLTEKGLEVLKATPGSLTQQSPPLGQQITAAIKSGTKETLRSLVNQALAVGVKIATHSAGFNV